MYSSFLPAQVLKRSGVLSRCDSPIIEWAIRVCLMFLMIGTNPLSSQAQSAPEPCVPDCSETPWSPAQTILIDADVVCSSGGPQFVRVTYHTRLACGIYHDFQIVNIEPLFPNWDIQCSSLSLFQWVHMRMVLDPTILSYPPNQTGECVSTWRVSTGSCWQIVRDLAGNDVITVCSDNTECCMSHFRVCQVEDNGFREMTLINTTASGPANCQDASEEYPLALECRAVCNWFGFPSGTPGDPPQGKRGAGDSNPTPDERSSITIFPNPAENLVNFEVLQHPGAGAYIEITDLLGSTLIVKRLPWQSVASSESLQLSIRLDALNSGAYNFRIVSNGQIKHSGVFSIVK